VMRGRGGLGGVSIEKVVMALTRYSVGRMSSGLIVLWLELESRTEEVMSGVVE
jgi:hypothetical protein